MWNWTQSLSRTQWGTAVPMPDVTGLHRRHLHACVEVFLGHRATEGYTDVGMSKSRGWKGRGQEARAGGEGGAWLGAPDGQDTCRPSLDYRKQASSPGDLHTTHRPLHPGGGRAEGGRVWLPAALGTFCLKKENFC